MMRMMLLVLLWPIGAYAQGDPQAAAPPSIAAGPPPTFAMIPVGLIQAACQKEKACGCSKGVDDCVKMFSGAGLPTATLACVAHQPCAVICESADAGQPGTALHSACLTPAAQAAAKGTFKENAVLASCATFRRCGCENRDPKACADSVIKETPKVSGAFFACVANQPCADVCDPNTSKPGGGIHTRCMQEALQASMALTIQTTQMMIRMSSDMQQRMHRTTMGIIRNMAPTPTRIDVYDQNGNFIRSE